MRNMHKKLPVLILAIVFLLQAFTPAVFAALKNEVQSQTAYLCPFDPTSEGAGKTGPKPFGIGAHNQKISEVADSVADGNIIAGGQRLPERAIPTPGGLKSSRRPDILVEKADGTMYGINVGKTTKTGAPIKREVEAMYDLEDIGLPMHFVPYK